MNTKVKKKVDIDEFTYYNDGSGDKFKCVSCPQKLIEACQAHMQKIYNKENSKGLTKRV